MRRALILALLGVSLGGCMIGPNYQRPPVDMPAVYRVTETDAAGTANTRWWTQFGDPILDGFVGEALRSNWDVRVAAYNVERAAGVIATTRAPLFPQASYGADASQFRTTKQGPEPVSTKNPDSEFQLFSGVTWELDLWGRVRRLTEASRAQLLASVEGRRGVVLTLVGAVASSYIQLRALDEQLAIAKRSLATYGTAVDLFKLQFKYGQVGEMIVAQARTQYASAEVAIPQIQAQIASVENALSILLGRNPGPIERGKSIQELTAFPVPAGLPSDLLERRPDVARAEQELIAANAEIGAARALYFPTMSLTGTIGVVSSDLTDLLRGSAEAWQYGGSLTGPLFTAGAIAGQVKQATATEKATLANYRSTILSALADVNTSLAAHQQLVAQLRGQRDLVDASRDYERLALLQYNGGYAPYFTVLQAEQQLFPAELDLATTRAQMLISLVNVFQSMGGGWVTDADETAAMPTVTGSTPVYSEHRTEEAQTQTSTVTGLP